MSERALTTARGRVRIECRARVLTGADSEVSL